MARMHVDEVDVDTSLVEHLVAGQFPQWADLPVERVLHDGTDHAIFRLGEELCVRLPRIGWASGQLAGDLRWMPWLGPQLPLRVPSPLEVGVPDEGYPWTWSVWPWIPGEAASLDVVEERQVALDLAAFVAALRSLETIGAPRPVPGSGARGLALSEPGRDDDTRAAIEATADLVDAGAALAVWEDAVAAAAYDGPGAWFHGDLMNGNLLCHDGRLRAVIDWGTPGVGDPAVDLMPAWLLLGPEGRAVYRDALGADDDQWRRARGWVVSVAVVGLAYYRRTSPGIRDRSIAAIGAAVAEAAP